MMLSEIIEIFIAKAFDENLVTEDAEVSNAYLYSNTSHEMEIMSV